VLFAASTDKTRLALNGVYLHPMRAHLEVAATDGHRMAWLSLGNAKGDSSLSQDKGWIIQPKTLSLFAHFLQGDSDLTVRANTMGIEFSSSAIKIMGRLVDGPYPNYRKVYAPPTRWQLDLPRQDFAQVLRRMIATLRGAANPRVHLAWKESTLHVSATGNGAQAAETLAVVGHGDIPSVDVNPHYLLDLLGRIGSPIVVMRGNEPTQAMLLTAQTADSLDLARWILMPIRPEEKDTP
jgi:DNA polymerase-3 subunit beta